MISIIIPNYNGSKTIVRCLEAVYASTYKKFEVIVVDDCSTDNSIEIIRNFDCKLVELSENKGPSYARNAGAKLAKGDILLFTDSDVCLPEDTLKKIDDTFSMEKDISAVVGMLDKLCKFENIVSQHFNLRLHFNFINMPQYIPILCSSICAVKREAFFSVNGFDTKFRTAGVEDDELGYRLTEQGYKIRLNKAIQVNHYKHVSFLKLLKNDFSRASDRAKLMLNKKKFKKIFKQKRFISTPIAQIYSLICIFIPPLFYYFNRKYLSFVRKEKGFLFALKAYFLLTADMTVVSLGIISGLLDYGWAWMESN